MASGEPSVALLLLWEADHGTEFPSRAVDITGRLSTFTKRLKDAVAVDIELQRWLEWKLMPFSLVPGLPCRVHIRWAVRIDPSVGEPFLGKWKAHVLEQVRQHQEASRSGASTRVSRLPRAPATSQRGRKRKLEGIPGVWVPPPSQNSQARVERLAKAVGSWWKVLLALQHLRPLPPLLFRHMVGRPPLRWWTRGFCPPVCSPNAGEAGLWAFAQAALKDLTTEYSL